MPIDARACFDHLPAQAWLQTRPRSSPAQGDYVRLQARRKEITSAYRAELKELEALGEEGLLKGARLERWQDAADARFETAS